MTYSVVQLLWIVSNICGSDIDGNVSPPLVHGLCKIVCTEVDMAAVTVYTILITVQLSTVSCTVEDLMASATWLANHSLPNY